MLKSLLISKLLHRLLTLRADLQGEMVYATDSGGKNPIAVAGAVTLYTTPILIRRADNIGYAIQVTVGTSPNLTITPQEAPVLPAAANINGADPNYITPNGVNSIGPFTNTNMNIGTLSLVPMKWVRFQIVGNTGNSSDVVVSIGLFMQELLA